MHLKFNKNIKFSLLFLVLFLSVSCHRQVCIENNNNQIVYFNDGIENNCLALQNKNIMLIEANCFELISFNANIDKNSFGCNEIKVNYTIEYQVESKNLINTNYDYQNALKTLTFNFSIFSDKEDVEMVTGNGTYLAELYSLNIEYFFNLINNSQSSIVLIEISFSSCKVISFVSLNENEIILDGYSDYFARFEIDWCYIEEDGRKIYPSNGATKQDIIDGFKNAFDLN